MSQTNLIIFTTLPVFQNKVSYKIMDSYEALNALEKMSVEEFPPPLEYLKPLGKEPPSLELIIRLFNIALKIKNHYFKNKIEFCAIINAKSGLCPEDCAFCAQSIRSKAKIKIYPLLEPEEVIEKAKEAEKGEAHRFSIVTSGRGEFTRKEKKKILRAVELIREKTSLLPDTSLGIVDSEFLKDLKKAGLTRFHNNLETAGSFYHRITTTHKQQDKIDTIKRVQDVGLEVCSGGILGLGESFEQRLELAYQLRELDVDSIPINFLHPIPGTPLENAHFITPLEALRDVAIFRMILPDKHILIAGGREYLMGDLQSQLILAGISGLMVGNYLTTKGRNFQDDIKMVQELGLQII